MVGQSFRSLPVILSSAIFVLGLAQGNLNFLFFFVGLGIAAPLAAMGGNLLWELVFSNTPDWLTVPLSLWKVERGSAQACSMYLVSGDSVPVTVNMVPSMWMTMMAFFFVYLFINGLKLYEKQEVSNAPKGAVTARKSQAALSMAVIVGLATVFTFMRYATGCETGLGVLLSSLLGGWLAVGWYKFMRACGLGRLDDIFGISNRILPMQSMEEQAPTVCVPE